MSAGGSDTARAVLALSLASGTLAISYEVLWTRLLLNLFGSTTTATAAMLAAFMAGMAIGAWAMGRWTPALRRPLAVYAALEVGLALYGLAFAGIVEAAGGYLPSIGAVGAAGLATALPIRLAVNFAILILPTVLMGATLPVLAAAVQASGGSRSRSLAKVYGLNTLGGVLGAFTTGFWLLESLGLSWAQLAVSGAAALIAFTAYAVDRRQARPSRLSFAAAEVPVPAMAAAPYRAILQGALLLSGFAAIGYEVVWTRILVLLMGSSTYAFSMMLGTYLLGLAFGALWIGRYLDQLKAPGTALRHLQLAVAISALGGVAVFPYLPLFVLAGISGLGTSVWGLALVNAAVAITLVMLPTFFLGAALPVAARLLQSGPPRRGRELGDAVAWLSAGHVGGVLATAFVIIPALGLQGGVVALASLNAAAAALLWLGAGRARGLAVPAGIATLAVIGWLLPPWDINIMTSGVYRQAPAYLSLLGSWRGLERAFSQYRTLFYQEGREAVVAVFERPTLSARPHMVLAIDGKVDASSGADMATQVLSGHLPGIFAPDARRALVIGLASGVTVGALLRHPLAEVDVVEIEAAVAGASRSFDPYSGAPLDDPRVNLVIEDGRQYLRTTARRYDVIISEPSNPWLSSSARLFTKEFFELARAHLSRNGVLLQWVPLYGLDDVQFRALLRTLTHVFPEIAVFSAAESDLLVVAGVDRLELGARALTAYFERPGVRGDLKGIGIHSAPELAARWVAERAGLLAAIGAGPLNTDDNGLIEFGSPWYVLRDTTEVNQATMARAIASVAIAEKLARSWRGREAIDALDRIARIHLAEDRYGLVRALAQELQKIDPGAGDLLLGDLAARRGNWAAATAIWQRHGAQAAWLRLAEWHFQNGNYRDAAAFYGRLEVPNRSPNAALNHGLALIALGDFDGAAARLPRPGAGPVTMPALAAPLLRAYALEGLGRREEAAAERRFFVLELDRLRQLLEREQGRKVLDALLTWINRQGAGLPAKVRHDLQARLQSRIMGPLAVYYRGVRLFWLGADTDAAAAFEDYLGMLPETGSVSRAREFLAQARKINGAD